MALIPLATGGVTPARVLLRVPGRQRPVFLDCSAMSGQLRHDLNHGGIELGEILDLEVSSIDLRHDKVCVRDVEAEDEAEGGSENLPQAA
ncbi:hypothetical protein ABZ690_36580 [Streptomyces sp. NPDC006967]|uniref:hypothetical protein n=1 Tax=Streptomyces sp. NPDC006967 TaxID=3156906 RepID=UPI0034027B1D